MHLGLGVQVVEAGIDTGNSRIVIDGRMDRFDQSDVINGLCGVNNSETQVRVGRNEKSRT